MKKKLITKYSLIIAGVLMLFMVNTALANGQATPKPTPVAKKSTVSKAKVVHPKVQFTMMNGKTMVIELYPEYAPATVENFVKLTKAKFYDGLKFHRIIDGFMIQGGDPLGNGRGGSGKTIKGECINNGFKKNTLKHTKGVISMARNPYSYDSASSQFFIMDGTATNLDGDYAAFGKLISGMKTLEEISKTPVGGPENSSPLKDVVIKKVVLLSDGKK